jgi:hypothetical protein
LQNLQDVFFLQTNGSGVLSFVSSGGKFESALLHVRDEKTANTGGGSASVGNNTRVLNTVKTNEISGASLATNTITLPSGTYFINVFAPSYNTANSKLRLRNTTDSSYTLEGQPNYLDPTYGVGTPLCLFGRFTITAQKDFQIYEYCANSQAGNGFGVACNQGTEVYAEAMIWKVA